MKKRKRTCDEKGRVCPVCGTDVFDCGTCDHVVTLLNDDSDLADTIAPIYFGNGLMLKQLDDLYVLVVRFAVQYSREDEQQRTATKAQVEKTGAEVRELLNAAIEAVEHPQGERGWYSSPESFVRGECFDQLNGYFVGLFYGLFHAQPSAIDTEDWRIDGHMVGWSGTTFWATDAEECVEGIVRLVDEYEGEVQKLLGE